MSKDHSDDEPTRIEPYSGSSRFTVWIVLSVSAVLAVVALVGTAV